MSTRNLVHMKVRKTHMGPDSFSSICVRASPIWVGTRMVTDLTPQIYDSVADVPESWVWLKADFQSGPRVLKKVFWTFSYLYLWHTIMWFNAEKLLKTLKFWKSLNLLCKSGSRPQKSPKKAQKMDHSIAIYSNFWIGMVYFGYHLVKPHVQTVQNMYGKGG